MSYTPEDQQLTEPRDKLLAALDTYMAVLRARAASSEWKSSHVGDCIRLHDDLMHLRARVKEL